MQRRQQIEPVSNQNEKKIFDLLRGKSLQLDQEYNEQNGYNSRLGPFLLYLKEQYMKFDDFKITLMHNTIQSRIAFYLMQLNQSKDNSQIKDATREQTQRNLMGLNLEQSRQLQIVFDQLQLLIIKSKYDPTLYQICPYDLSYDNILKCISLCVQIGLYRTSFMLFIQYFSENLYALNNVQDQLILRKQNQFMLKFYKEIINKEIEIERNIVTPQTFIQDSQSIQHINHGLLQFSQWNYDCFIGQMILQADTQSSHDHQLIKDTISQILTYQIIPVDNIKIVLYKYLLSYLPNMVQMNVLCPFYNEQVTNLFKIECLNYYPYIPPEQTDNYDLYFIEYMNQLDEKNIMQFKEIDISTRAEQIKLLKKNSRIMKLNDLQYMFILKYDDNSLQFEDFLKFILTDYILRKQPVDLLSTKIDIQLMFYKDNQFSLQQTAHIYYDREYIDSNATILQKSLLGASKYLIQNWILVDKLTQRCEDQFLQKILQQKIKSVHFNKISNLMMSNIELFEIYKKISSDLYKKDIQLI